MEVNNENKERYGIIYKIENTVNGKCYIGQTTKSFNRRYSFPGEGIERVYRHHKYHKEHNKHYNIHLLRSIEKYGFEAFDVIEEFDAAYSKEELNDLEKKYIKEFNCINNGYNHEDGGSNGKPSEETCKKISEKAKERCKDPEYRRKKSEAMKGKNCGENSPLYGKPMSEETRRKMSEKAKERFKNPDERRKQSEARKGKFAGKNNPNYGNGYKISGENNPNARKIVCLNDNMVFDTIKKCAEYYKLDIHTIIRNCKGKIKKSRTGLIFMYYDEYIQQ